jgi:hypothetical protein
MEGEIMKDPINQDASLSLTLGHQNSVLVQGYPWSTGVMLVPERRAFLDKATRRMDFDQVLEVALVCTPL